MSKLPSKSDSGVGARVVEITVRVAMNGRGAWELTVANEPTRIVCQTLADATRKARSIAGMRPAELIIHDAYHRLVGHERLGVVYKHHG